MKLTAIVFALAVLGAALPAAANTFNGYANAPGVYWLSLQALPPLTNVKMSQAQGAFVPKVLVVPVGSSVSFEAGDASCGTVFSDSHAAQFMVHLPGANSVTFLNPGPFPIGCRGKASMHGTIIVVNGPYAVVNHTGNYAIKGVIPGPHTLHAWTGGTNVSSMTQIVY